MTLLYLINTSTTVRARTDDIEAYATTNNDEKDRGLDLTLPRCMQKEQAHPSQTLNKTKKILADLARRQRSHRRKRRRGPVMAAAKTWAGAWRGVLEGELVTATAIDHYWLEMRMDRTCMIKLYVKIILKIWKKVNWNGASSQWSCIKFQEANLSMPDIFMGGKWRQS